MRMRTPVRPMPALKLVVNIKLNSQIISSHPEYIVTQLDFVKNIFVSLSTKGFPRMLLRTMGPPLMLCCVTIHKLITSALNQRTSPAVHNSGGHGGALLPEVPHTLNKLNKLYCVRGGSVVRPGQVLHLP